MKKTPKRPIMTLNRGAHLRKYAHSPNYMDFANIFFMRLHINLHSTTVFTVNCSCQPVLPNEFILPYQFSFSSKYHFHLPFLHECGSSPALKLCHVRGHAFAGGHEGLGSLQGVGEVCTGPLGATRRQ